VEGRGRRRKGGRHVEKENMEKRYRIEGKDKERKREDIGEGGGKRKER